MGHRQHVPMQNRDLGGDPRRHSPAWRGARSRVDIRTHLWFVKYLTAPSIVTVGDRLIVPQRGLKKGVDWAGFSRNPQMNSRVGGGLAAGTCR